MLNKSSFVIASLDPGLAIIGWSLIRSYRGQLDLLGFGTITTPAGQKLGKRLASIHKEVSYLLRGDRISYVAAETPFLHNTNQNQNLVKEAMGVIRLAAYQQGYDLLELTPSRVKLLVSGSGNANKEEMQVAVSKYFGLKQIIQPDDANDAVAIGLAAIWNER